MSQQIPEGLSSSSGRPPLQYFPDFMAIGPQRTGTTWLYENLRTHPQVCFSEPKELYFFSDLKHNHRGLPDDLDWYLKHFRDTPLRYIRREVACRIRYGEAYRPIRRGEATASYAALSPEIITKIHELSSRLKVIVFIRDPVERAWSNAKRVLLRNRRRQYNRELDGEFVRFFSTPFERRCADFVGHIDRWTAVFGEDSVHVGWFADLRDDPGAKLREIWGFLGLDSSPKYVPRKLSRTVNPTRQDLRIPNDLRECLETLHEEHRQRLVERFGRYG